MGMEEKTQLEIEESELLALSARIGRYLLEHEGETSDDGSMLQMFKGRAMAKKFLGLSSDNLLDEDYPYRSSLPKVPVNSLEWLDNQNG